MRIECVLDRTLDEEEEEALKIFFTVFKYILFRSLEKLSTAQAIISFFLLTG